MKNLPVQLSAKAKTLLSLGQKASFSREDKAFASAVAKVRLSNASGVWRPGSGPQKFDDWVGLTMSMVSLHSKGGHQAAVGVAKTMYKDKLNYGVFGMHAASNYLFATPLQPMPDTDYVYLEVDVDPKNGNVKFWINDTGLDMGELPDFKGGAVRAAWGAAAFTPNTYLISGSFTDCMQALIGFGWMPANLAQSNVRNVKPNQNILVKGREEISFSDKRAVV